MYRKKEHKTKPTVMSWSTNQILFFVKVFTGFSEINPHLYKIHFAFYSITIFEEIGL